MTKPLVPSMGSRTLICRADWGSSFSNQWQVTHTLDNCCVHIQSDYQTSKVHQKKLAQVAQTRSWPSSASKPASMLVKKSSRVKSPPDSSHLTGCFQVERAKKWRNKMTKFRQISQRDSGKTLDWVHKCIFYIITYLATVTYIMLHLSLFVIAG